MQTVCQDINGKSSRSNICQVDALLVDASTLQEAIYADPILSKVLSQYVRRRWPDQMGTCFQPYKKIRNELSIEGDCFLRCTIVVVPLKLRDKVLNKLHKGHCEIVRMKKALSRSYVW